MPKKFPDHLTILVLSRYLEDPIPPMENNDWPHKLQRIEFSHTFNHPIPPAWPIGLKHLHTGYEFNHPIPAEWNCPLLDLALGHKFSQPLPEKWPRTLHDIYFGDYFTEEIPEQWPSNVQNIRFGKHFMHDRILDEMPSSIKVVFAPRCNKELCTKLKHQQEKSWFNLKLYLEAPAIPPEIAKELLKN